MSNMSAQIVRQIAAVFVSSFEDKKGAFKVQHIKLAGELPADYNLNQGDDYSSSCGSSWDNYHVYSFDGTSWNQLPTSNDSATGSGDRHYVEAKPISEVATGSEIFFLIYNTSNSGTWNNNATQRSWTLYKAPNFKQHWAAIEAADVARWEEWLNG